MEILESRNIKIGSYIKYLISPTESYWHIEGGGY